MNETRVLLSTFNSHHPNHYFSLALGFLKAYALKDKVIEKNVKIEIVDFCVECNSAEQVLLYLSSAKPDILALACYIWNANTTYRLIRLAKQVLPNMKIVLGGPEVGPDAKGVLSRNPAADVVVRGEGEATFAELLKFFTTKKGNLANIQGITYRKAGEILSSPDRPLIENLDDIPSPYLTGAILPKDQVTYLETYRGCPYNCSYCYEGKHYGKLRHFSKDRVWKEIEMVMKTQTVQSFSFVDPVFNLSPKKTKELTRMLAEANTRGVSLHTIEMATETMDEKTVTDFKAASVVSVETGPQSVNEETLKTINRGFNKEKFSRGVTLCVDNGFKVLCDLIIGLPGDDFFKFIRSVRYVMSLKPAVIIFSTLNVLPGTDLYNRREELGLTFNEEAPHQILSNSTFPYRQMRKAEVLATSLAKEYTSVI